MTPAQHRRALERQTELYINRQTLKDLDDTRITPNMAADHVRAACMSVLREYVLQKERDPEANNQIVSVRYVFEPSGPDVLPAMQKVAELYKQEFDIQFWHKQEGFMLEFFVWKEPE